VTSQFDKRNLSSDLSSSTCAQNTSVGPGDFIEGKVPILGTFSQNSEFWELFQIMSK